MAHVGIVPPGRDDTVIRDGSAPRCDVTRSPSSSTSGHGAMRTSIASAIVTPGLWALQFGNGLNAQPANTLFYTAGPGAEAKGLYGRIDMN